MSLSTRNFRSLSTLTPKIHIFPQQPVSRGFIGSRSTPRGTFAYCSVKSHGVHYFAKTFSTAVVLRNTTMSSAIKKDVLSREGWSTAAWTSEDQFAISPKAKQILMNYSGISEYDIKGHVVAIVWSHLHLCLVPKPFRYVVSVCRVADGVEQRDKAWKVFPCMFDLRLNLPLLNQEMEIIE